MAGLSTRLARVEATLMPKQEVFLGTFELHYTEAWPDCLNYPGKDYHHCTEHGPDCTAIVTPTTEPFRRMIVLEGAGAGPAMGLD
jgi:hypothetical protein